MCSVLIAKTRENLFVVTEVLILSQKKEGFCEFFCASNGSKMGDNSSSSGSSSSSSSSGSSSDSPSSDSSSYSDERKVKEVPEVINQPGRDMDPCLGTGISEMNESNDDVSIVTYKPFLNLYPKVEDDTVMNDEDY